jgi:hypothetical protein
MKEQSIWDFVWDFVINLAESIPKTTGNEWESKH